MMDTAKATNSQGHSPTMPPALRRACKSDPTLERAVEWLERRGYRPLAVVEDSIKKLRRRGRSLPAKSLERYANSVVSSEYLFRWRVENDGRPWEELIRDPQSGLREAELILLGQLDASAFRKTRGRMARISHDRAFNITRGTDDEFESFVTDHSRYFAKKYFENFDPSRPRAAASVLSYLRVTATSLFLSKRTKPVRQGMPNVIDYLDGSSRLNDRTKIAVKLAYFPYLVDQNERRMISREYGWDVSTCTLYPIKTIADRLGFRTAAALSRRLYRVREWCQKSAQKEEARVEQRA